MEERYKNLKEFYPYYLREHSLLSTRRLHFIGTALFIAITLYCIVTAHWKLLFLCPVAGYGFAWVGHYFFEKNKPATFKYPLYSLSSDFIMFYHFLTGQLHRRLNQAQAEN